MGCVRVVAWCRLTLSLTLRMSISVGFTSIPIHQIKAPSGMERRNFVNEEWVIAFNGSGD